MLEMTTWIVLAAALATALATGLGALPFAFVRNMPARWVSICNGVAAGLMLAASFGLISEGMEYNKPGVILGILAGFGFIAFSHKIIDKHEGELSFGNMKGADARKALMIVGIMTMHSAAEGIGVGVSFGGSEGLGLLITSAIAVHNIPEGLAIALVMIPRGSSVGKAAWWGVFSSLPQPLLAVPAFMFVTIFSPVLPFGLGLAAGAMIWMTLAELIPEALEEAKSPTIAGAVTMSVAGMLMLEYLLDFTG